MTHFPHPLQGKLTAQPSAVDKLNTHLWDRTYDTEISTTEKIRYCLVFQCGGGKQYSLVTEKPGEHALNLGELHRCGYVSSPRSRQAAIAKAISLSVSKSTGFV